MHKLNLSRLQIVVKGEKSPLLCPVCNFVLRDNEDVKSVKAESACTECIINFKYANFGQWEKGWRPSIEEARTKIHI
jgi:hypothetical protein